MKTVTFFLFVSVCITQHHCESAVLQGDNEREDSRLFKEQDDGSAVEDTLAQDGKESQSNTGKGQTETGSKKALPALAMAALKNPKVQEAVVDKGLEVMGKLVDKQLKIIDEAQEKASKFLAKEIKLDIMPDKGWSTPDMFVPPGYHMGASISDTEQTEKEHGEQPFNYAPNMGLGYVMMNGCYGTNYTPSDPCYNAKFASPICLNMIDGAAFMGVGFDGRGKYSPESRKMSIVQRNCKNKASYDDLDVPDTMNVHGVYDTSAYMLTFESRSEYRSYIQQEAGVSGSIFGFYAGVKEAYGSSSSGASQTFLSVLYVDVDRYEIFMDEVKPQDLSLSFLREFMNLPNSYFEAGAPLKYQNFIQRWGTHYIKSAKFGGQLQIRKTKQAKQGEKKTEFAVEMEMEYKTLFSSVGAKYSQKNGYQQREQVKTSSTSIMAQGGSQEIASILSDAYSPTFKAEFKEWLQSIPRYPKAFKFLMGSIVDLVNFRSHDLFPEEKVTWGCEGKVADMETEDDGRRFYYNYSPKGKKTKVYCQYDNRKGLEEAIMARRTSLSRAIEIYMEEGPISLSEVKLDKCTVSRRDEPQFTESLVDHAPLSWKDLVNSGATYQVTFDMLDDLLNPLHEAYSIKRNMTRKLHYRGGEWYTSDERNVFHLYSGFGEKVTDMRRHKISIFGLTLTYKEKDGSLVLEEDDFKSAKKTFPAIPSDLKGMRLAHIEALVKGKAVKRADPNPTTPPPPPPICKPRWSNAFRLELENVDGKCLHFTAASTGPIQVLFSAKPGNEENRYGVVIEPTMVRMFKGKDARDLKHYVTNVDAVGLGTKSLYDAYFVCITVSGERTLIEYGKSKGTRDIGNVFLSMVDRTRNFDVRFYAFGNEGDAARIVDAHIVSRKLFQMTCREKTVKDAKESLCMEGCHRACDPFESCSEKDNDKKCNKCRFAKDPDENQCLEECLAPKTLKKNKDCVDSFDYKVEQGNSLLHGNVLPGAEEYTVCFWLRLAKDWVKNNNGYDTVADFVALRMRAVSGSDYSFGYQARGPTSLRIDWDNRRPWVYIEFASLGDKNWHQLCHTWSSRTSAWAIYLDGNKERTGLYDFRVASGFEIYFPHYSQMGSNLFLLSQLNVWDKFYSSQEIQKLSEKCNAGVGNVASWVEMYDAKKKAMFSKPSKCKAKPEIPKTTPTTPSTTPTTTATTTTTKPTAPPPPPPESFDFKIEQNNNLLKVGKALPGAEEYTLCFWLQLTQNWVENSGGYDTSAELIELEMKAVSGDDYSIAYQSRGPTVFRFDWDNRKTWEILEVASLEDKNWHQVCHTWSSKTSTWSIYMDGIQKKTGSYQFRTTSWFKISFPRSGSSIGSNKFLLSQVNVWNRIFTSDEIKTLSKKCDAGTGNVASWADMYVRNKKAMFSVPSKCKPKPGAYDLNIAKGVWIGNKQGSGTFEEYTLCFWLKIENWVRVQGSNTAVQLVLTSMTVNGASLPISLTYTLRGDEITDIRLEVGDFYKSKTRQSMGVLADKNWHHVCHLWSTKTNEVKIFVDGKAGATGTLSYGSAPTKFDISLGPGNQGFIGTNKLYLSQVNVWDRLLTSADITQYSQSCNAGIGNLVSWANMYDESKVSWYTKPSNCKVPSGSTRGDSDSPQARRHLPVASYTHLPKHSMKYRK